MIVAYQEDTLTLEVTDDGSGAAASGDASELPVAGNGIIGMRERAAMYGGEVWAAPLPGRGFQVTARFPLADTGSLDVGHYDPRACRRRPGPRPGSFRVLVDTAPDLTSVGEAATGTEAVEIAQREKPDIVLMDIRMPDMDGIEATRKITADPQTSAVRVLILTTFDLDEYVFAALRAVLQRLPAQGHPAGRPAGRGQGRGGRRRTARPRGHPAAHRGVHQAPRTRAAPSDGG